MDHGLTEQSCILRFIEDKRKLGRARNHSFGPRTGSPMGTPDLRRQMSQGAARHCLLDPVTGEVRSESGFTRQGKGRRPGTTAERVIGRLQCAAAPPRLRRR